jgi:hypothetical protein
MKILIDARLYGTKNTGPGRYVMELVQNLAKIDYRNEYVIFLRSEIFTSLILPKNFTKVLTDIKHYTFAEQFKLPLLIRKYKPDIVHFPHFNVPILYFGKYIVTIHDLIMHKFTDKESTTRSFPIHSIWRLGYHISFAKAVYGSVKIITPSKTIKKELADFYKIGKEKIEVTYE